MTSRILVVDDNPDIAMLLKVLLEGDGYQVETSATAEKGEQIARSTTPDLIIVDVGLPGMRGHELVRRLRTFTEVPIIFLTAATSEADQLEGFAAGGSDYVLKPFLPHVLKARVRAHLERRGPRHHSVIDLGDVQIDLSARSVTAGSSAIDLTRHEYAMFAVLCENVGRILSKSELMGSVWGGDWGDGHVVENTLHRLRAKLKDAGLDRSVVTTHRGLGYRANRVAVAK